MRDGRRFSGWLSGYFAGLSTSQRIAAGLLLLVMIATGAWLGGRSRSGIWAAGTVMEPVLDQPFAEADIRGITDRLNQRSIPHQVRDGKVYVPADKKIDALSDLYYNAILTGGSDVGNGFDALTKQMSVFDPPSKTDKLFNRAREQTCERVISRFHGVRKTTVYIDATNERHIGGSVLPTAMVDIQTQGESNPRQLSAAVVNVLTGCVSQLVRDQVKVTIDGSTYNAPAGAAGADALVGADDLIARKQQFEQAYSTKVRRLLSYIPDVMVSVSVDLNVQSSEEERHTVDPKTAGASVVPAAAAAATTTATGAATPDELASAAGSLVANALPNLAENGEVSPNAAATTAPPARPAEPHSKQSDAAAAVTTETVQKSRTPAGKETVRSASVVVPRSYFVGIYRRANRKQSQAADPDDALLQPVIAAHLLKIRGLVKNSLGLGSDDDVTVESYDDFATGTASAAVPDAIAAPASTANVVAAVTTPTPALFKANPQQVALAGMSLLSLVLLSLLVRKRTAAPSATIALGVPGGRGGGSGAILSGTLETLPPSSSMHGGPGDDSTTAAAAAESHRMFHRVRDVVGENPDDAARVLREWIYQGQ
jgi:flagellar biosynthesis/type III secretory pathway M-ring protein FliF/YscJ